MRRVFVLAGLLVGTALVSGSNPSRRLNPLVSSLIPHPSSLRAAAAIPPPSTLPEPAEQKERERLRNEVRLFANQLLSIVDQISESYVRPIPREVLVHAALVGLYQAARQPVPRNLPARIKQAAGNPAALIARTALAPGEIPAPNEDGLTRLCREVRKEIRPDGLQGQNAIVVCCQAMAHKLDPHSGVVTTEEQLKQIGLDQECEGYGLEIRDTGMGPLVVEAVQPGGPAQQAGLRPGDQITAVDGKPVRSLPAPDRAAMRNQRAQPDLPVLDVEGKAAPPRMKPPVKLTWRRPPDKDERSATLQRQRFRPETVLGVTRQEDNSWNWYADPKMRIAQVRLTHLGRGTGEELREVLERLREKGLHGLILDLRWCPGGYLNEAVEVADLFLGEGVVATVKTRLRDDTVYRSDDRGKFRDFPLVVLVNGETSGGAELIAAALQDHHRATIVGQRTVGKGSVQTPIGIGIAGKSFKLTSGVFIRPSGRELHRFPESKPEDDWGIIPDDGGDCRVSRDLSKRLKEWWQWQSLRPAASRERLPLDDPRADPQQQAALAAVRKLLEKARGG